jgi:hypothetical protein
LQALTAGNTRRAACAYAGVSEDAFAAWLGRYADFADAVKKAEAQAEVKMVATVVQASTKQWQAAAWWLERRRADDFSRRDKVEITVRQHAEKLAAELGLDPEELIAEAERIVASH